MKTRPLPSQVEELLLSTKASPRLKAHLTLVHDVACCLTERLGTAWPKLTYNAESVGIGAAIHDIGKAVHPEELSAPGHIHEQAGQKLLLENGWPEPLARFAVTHATDFSAANPMEDLLVALADKIWKGKREDALEQMVMHRIAAATGEEPWQVWLTLDDIFTDMASTADERLNWQASHKV
jgi:hypothetical protein